MAGRARAKWLGAVQWQPRIWPHLRESERRGTSQKDGCDIHSAKSMYYSFDGRNEFIQIMLSGNPYQRGLKSSGSGHLNRQHSRQCIGPLPAAPNSLRQTPYHFRQPPIHFRQSPVYFRQSPIHLRLRKFKDQRHYSHHISIIFSQFATQCTYRTGILYREKWTFSCSKTLISWFKRTEPPFGSFKTMQAVFWSLHHFFRLKIEHFQNQEWRLLLMENTVQYNFVLRNSLVRLLLWDTNLLTNNYSLWGGTTAQLCSCFFFIQHSEEKMFIC